LSDDGKRENDNENEEEKVRRGNMRTSNKKLKI